MKPQHLLYEKMLRHCCREDPLGVDQRMCVMNMKKCCVGFKNHLLFLMVLSYGSNFKRSLMRCEKIVTRKKGINALCFLSWG